MRIQYLFIIFLLLSITNACTNSGNADTAAVAAIVAGGVVAGAAGAGAVVIGASIIGDLPIEFDEIKQDEVLKIEFKDREFLESKITDSAKIYQVVSQIKQSSMIDPVDGDFYRTVELVLTNDRVVRIGVHRSYLKNGNDYYQMEKELNEEIKKHF